MSQEIVPSPLDAKAVIRKEHLRLLSIAYYISGAISVLYVSILLLHLVFLIVIASIPDNAWTTNHNAVPPPRFIFVVFAVVIGCVILAGWAAGGLTIFAGRCIRERKRRIFVLVMAAINCAFFPYGTMLGVLSFILLCRAEAMREFQYSRSQS